MDQPRPGNQPRRPRGARGRIGTSPALEIPELIELILSNLSIHRDLISMACTARRYTDVALRLAWENPDFPGDPLRNMASLFPEPVKISLLGHIPDLSIRIPQDAFVRFDYYAKFVRHLQVWRFQPDAHIGNVLSASRPGVTLFPFLESIHLGADGDSLQMASPFLSPTLDTVRINHWESGSAIIVNSSPGVTATILQILRLPGLKRLDLLDTRYPQYEHDQAVIDHIIRAVPKLAVFYSYDFTTLTAVFDALSSSKMLKATFLDLTDERPGHYPFTEVVRLLRSRFLSLQELVLQCVGPRGRELIEQSARALHCFNFRIEGALGTDDLAELTESLRASIPTLRVFKCSTSLRAEPGSHTLLHQALTPLMRMTKLQKIVITITVHGENMFRDEHVEELFQAWPCLCVCTLESDPDEGTPIDVGTPSGYGLTLNCLLTIRRCCSNLYELSIPYIDTTHIPELTDHTFTRHHLPFEIHLSRCHAHNRYEIKQFIQAIWLKAESSFEDCSCPELVHDT